MTSQWSRIEWCNTNADCAAVATCPRGAPQVLFLNFANVFESFLSSPHLPLNYPIIVMLGKPQNDASTFSMFNVCFSISPFLVGLWFTLLYSTMCILSTIPSAIWLLLRLLWFQFLSPKDLILIEKYTSLSIFVNNTVYLQKILGVLLLNIFFLCLRIFISKS